MNSFEEYIGRMNRLSLVLEFLFQLRKRLPALLGKREKGEVKEKLEKRGTKESTEKTEFQA